MPTWRYTGNSAVLGRWNSIYGLGSRSFKPPLDPSAPAVRKRPHGRDSIEGIHASVSLYAPEWNSPASTAPSGDEHSPRGEMAPPPASILPVIRSLHCC